MKTIKVCHICAALDGATWMVEQLRELRNRFGYDVYAVVVDENCELAKKLRAVGINVLCLPFAYQSLKEMVFLPLMIFKLAGLLRRERFDVVQTHLFISMLVGRIASWLADTPVRLTMCASPFHLEARISRYVDRATAWMETGIIASCEKTVELYEQIGVPREKIFLTYYGPDERKFNPEEISPTDIRKEFDWAADTPVVSLVAYFYPEMPKSGWIPEVAFNRAIKGHETFVEAAQIILKTLPNAKFLMVGPGWFEEGEKYRQKIITLVNDSGLEKDVIFTGYRSDVNGILRSVNVAVQAPVIENLGGTVEALMMRRPLVATRVGGIPDSVRDGETGILVAPDDAEDLARGILQMLQNSQKAEQMAENGRRLMLERFSLSRTIDDLHELYQNQTANQKRNDNSLLVFLWRQIAVLPIYAYLGFRVLFLEYIMRIYFRVWVMILRSRIQNVFRKTVAVFHHIRIGIQIIFRKIVAAGYYLLTFFFSTSKINSRKIKRVKD